MNYERRKYYAEVAITDLMLSGVKFDRPVDEIAYDIVYAILHGYFPRSISKDVYRATTLAHWLMRENEDNTMPLTPVSGVWSIPLNPRC